MSTKHKHYYTINFLRLSTGIDKDALVKIIEKFSSVPEGFNLHRGLERILKGIFIKPFILSIIVILYSNFNFVKMSKFGDGDIFIS